MQYWKKTLNYLLLGALAAAYPANCLAQPPFVQVREGQFYVQDQPYRFTGANFWHAMYLGAELTPGDRAKLTQELDELRALGITNLRIMASSQGPESEPNRAHPALQPAPGMFNEALLQGLDFALAEMGKRNMKAVLCLNNFFQWSGGMAQYVAWAGNQPIPYPEIAGWDTFQKFSAGFYSTPGAQRFFRHLIRELCLRKNTVNGLLYKEDPAIMSWQLANEPREFGQDTPYFRWVRKTGRLIQRLVPLQLLSIGNEGQIDERVGSTYEKTARLKQIDYLTVHLWPQNWGWYNPLEPSGTFPKTLELTTQYLRKNAAVARDAGKPIVLEEFGLARDEGHFEGSASVRYRDQFFEHVFEHSLLAPENPYHGMNIWSWSGYSHPETPGQLWKTGQTFTGDPPHERQGWYGVYQSDTSTITLLRQLSQRIRKTDQTEGSQ